MSRNPASRKLRAAESSTLRYASAGTVIVPAWRMCPVGGLRLPSGTYAMTGATSALPSSCAILPESTFTRTLCLPSTMCGPFCSVPPMGTRTVVLPARIETASSGDVRSSRKTLAGACASAGAAATSKTTISRRNVGRRMGAFYATPPPVSGDLEPARRGVVLKASVLAEEGEVHRPDRPVALLADDDLGLALFPGVAVVDLVAVDEEDHVRVLLERARLAQVRHHRALVVARLDAPVQLRKRDHRYRQLLRERLERARD